MEKYTCDVCGYEYDPNSSDEAVNSSDKSFAGLPDDWICPVCGAGKSEFSKS